MRKRRWDEYDNIKKSFLEWLQTPDSETGDRYSTKTIKNYITDINTVVRFLFNKKSLIAWEFLATDIYSALAIYFMLNKGLRTIIADEPEFWVKERIEYYRKIVHQLQTAQHIKKLFSIKLYVAGSFKKNYIGRIPCRDLPSYMSIFNEVSRIQDIYNDEKAIAELGRMYELDEKSAINFVKKGFSKGLSGTFQLIIGSNKTKNTTKQLNALVQFARFLQETKAKNKIIPTYSRFSSGTIIVPEGISKFLAMLKVSASSKMLHFQTWYGYKTPVLPTNLSFRKKEIAKCFACNVRTLDRIPEFKENRLYTAQELMDYMKAHSCFRVYPGVDYKKKDFFTDGKFTYWKTAGQILKNSADKRYLELHYRDFTYIAYVPGCKKYYAPEIRKFFKKRAQRKKLK